MSCLADEKSRLFAEAIEHLTESQKLSIYYFLNELKLEQNSKQRPTLQCVRQKSSLIY